MSSKIPNMIKQPADCCIYCGKSYKLKQNLKKHVIICELLNDCKQHKNAELCEDLPSQRKMYHLLLELGSKFNRLEEKVDELNSWVIKKKKKIDVIEWLNLNMQPNIIFDELISKINITQEDIDYLCEGSNSFSDTLNQIFSRNIYNYSENEYPIFAFDQKPNTFYIYENNETKWILLNKEKMVKFLNKIYMKLFCLYRDYKKNNTDRINKDDRFSNLCDKLSIKMTKDVQLEQELYFNKIKNKMYSSMKIDMKGLIEYEFEF